MELQVQDSLFEMVKEHILKNPTNENVEVLSSISNVGDKYDYHSIENALDAIQNRFAGKGSLDQRIVMFSVYGERILVANAEQLVANYNRILANVRKTFPAFNLVHEGHNGIFGSLASVSCDIRRCSDEDIRLGLLNREFHPRQISGDDIADEIEVTKEYYEKDYVDSFLWKTRQVSTFSGSTSQAISKNLSKIINYTGYGGNEFLKLNAILRCDKSTSTDYVMQDLVKSFSRFGINLALPMYINDDLTLYRGDGMTTSPQKLTTRGFYSGSLSPHQIGKFVTDGGRMIKINVPSGTHFLPIIKDRIDEGEIVLLPGTVLEKQSGMAWATGHYAEYTVVSNPPKLPDVEEATLLMNAIQMAYPDFVSSYQAKGPGTKADRRKFIDSIPKPMGPTMDEMEQFMFDLVNSRYHGDW